MELDQAIFFLIAFPIFVIFLMIIIDFLTSIGTQDTD